jgi:hypothetical protein
LRTPVSRLAGEVAAAKASAAKRSTATLWHRLALPFLNVVAYIRRLTPITHCVSAA